MRGFPLMNLLMLAALFLVLVIPLAAGGPASAGPAAAVVRCGVADAGRGCRWGCGL